MLKLIKVNSKNQIWEQFQTIDIERDSWVVAKTSERELMSRFLMARDGYFLDLNVHWQVTFFRMIFERAFPDYKIVSREFAQAYLKRKMESLKSELSIDVIDENSRLRSMTYYAALIFDPDLDESKLEEWLSLSEERRLRLKPDLLLNKLFVSFFLQDKIVCEDWVVAQLQGADLSTLQLPMKRLFFDLGVEYGMLEASVLQKLAKNHDLVLFQITHLFDQKYGHLLQAYERFDQLENKSQMTESHSISNATVMLKKFSSPISEIRFAIAQLQEWRGQGVIWDEMAIVAPDIKKYQDPLCWQLLAEEIPTNQLRRSQYVEFQDIRELLSDMSFFKNEIEFVSVKESILRYCNENRKVGAFAKLEEKLNSPFLSADQFLILVDKWLPDFFGRHMGMGLATLKEFRLQEMNIQKFVTSTELFWERAGLGERKEKIINGLFDSSAASVKLTVEEWVMQIEQMALQSFVDIGVPQSKGVQISSLNQATLHGVKNVFILGMDESGFTSQFKEAIPTDDIFHLNSELGVYLEHPDLSVNSFLLDEVLSQISGTAVLSYCYKSIESTIQNPAPQWQNRAFEQKLFEQEADSAPLIRWDWLLANRESHWLHMRKQDFKLLSLDWDSQPDLIPSLEAFSLDEISLSPSSVQTFLDCKQKFFFQRILRLKNVESESFDVNAREKGSWYHSIFEKIIAQDNKYIQPVLTMGWNETTKNALLETLLIDFADVVPAGFSDSMWNLVKKMYFENVTKFVAHEVDLRSKFPELKNVVVEWPWEVYYDWRQFEFRSQASPNSVRISGVIDRVLLNEKTQKLWIVDYKSSVKNYSSFGSWIANKEFQLLLYNHIVQNHCAEPWQASVENLSYWQLPDLGVKKGFALGDARLLDMGYAKKTIGTIQEKEKLESEFLIHFQEMIAQMGNGHFYPQPADEKNCSYCEWRLGCRAPHL
ncbi:MAG: PD-(D/E)XK nuclease family protein [Bdellovibrionaceae bacterium]|nr:PD-(D/E)XK nuclease family protein [Pseudobdellovibrionaceae bacterium]